MQTVRNGIFAEIEDFNHDEMVMKFKDREVDHVEVFPGTPENIAERKSKIGKKYKLSKGFKKAPKIK